MFSLAWNVPNAGSLVTCRKRYLSQRAHFPWSLSTTCSTLLTSSFIDSFFHSLTFHSLLYSSDPSFISLINNRWDTAWFPQTLEKLSVASSATQFWSMSKMFLFLLETKPNNKKSTIHLCKLSVTDGWQNRVTLPILVIALGWTVDSQLDYITWRHNISSLSSFVYCENQYWKLKGFLKTF